MMKSVTCCLVLSLCERAYSVLATRGRAEAGRTWAVVNVASPEPCFHYYAAQVVVGTRTNSAVNYA